MKLTLARAEVPEQALLSQLDIVWDQQPIWLPVGKEPALRISESSQLPVMRIGDPQVILNPWIKVYTGLTMKLQDNRRTGENAMERLLLDAEEVALALRIGRSKVYSMMARGELPTIRLGRAVRVSKEDLQLWVQVRTANRTRDVNHRQASRV